MATCMCCTSVEREREASEAEDARWVNIYLAMGLIANRCLDVC